MSKSIDPNLGELYGGLSNIELSFDQFDFGHGISLSKTYAHFMAPYLLAFAQAAPGKPHPPPWKSAGGGIAYDITAEIFIPREFSPPSFFNRVNTVWLLTALLRLITAPLIFAPVLSSQSIKSIAGSKEEPYFWPMEVHTKRLVRCPPFDNVNYLTWIRNNWEAAGWLMCKNNGFYLAFRAFDQSTFNTEPALALVSLWGALETLFSPSQVELKFRTSSMIAAFLEQPGNQRLEGYRHIQKLYDSRSKAAHGSGHDEGEAYKETFIVLRRALIKIIEANHLPNKKDLEALLFGGNSTHSGEKQKASDASK